MYFKINKKTKLKLKKNFSLTLLQNVLFKKKYLNVLSLVVVKSSQRHINHRKQSLMQNSLGNTEQGTVQNTGLKYKGPNESIDAPHAIQQVNGIHTQTHWETKLQGKKYNETNRTCMLQFSFFEQ